jgi:hypothetical protein
MDAVDEVLDAQRKFLEMFAGLQRSGEALRQMKTLVDQVAGAEKQLESVQMHAAEVRQRAAAELEQAKANARVILQRAQADAAETIAKAKQVGDQVIAAAHAHAAKIVAAEADALAVGGEPFDGARTDSGG